MMSVSKPYPRGPKPNYQDMGKGFSLLRARENIFVSDLVEEDR